MSGIGVNLDLTTATSQAGSDIAVDLDFTGMCHSGYSNNLDREYTMLNEMGVTWLHRDFSWSSIEPSDGNFQFERFDTYVQRANAEGKKIIGMLLYNTDWVHDKFNHPRERRIHPDEIPDFCEYAVETVKRYNGNHGYGYVDAWFIWNEPDILQFWRGTQSEYFALNKAVAEAIRNLDQTEGTTTTLVGGVFTALVDDSWINGLFSSGGGDLLDGIAYHPYSARAGSTMNMVTGFRQKLVTYGLENEIWANEVGYPTYPDRGSPTGGLNDQYEGNMPELVAQTVTVLAAAGTKNFAYYHLFDSGPNRDEYGLIWQKSAAEWVRKGGYWGYTICAKNIPGKTYKQLTFSEPVPSELRYYYFEGDTSRTLVVWNNDPLDTMNVYINLPLGRNYRLWDVETGQSRGISRTSNHTLYPINTYQKTLAFITWDK